MLLHGWLVHRRLRSGQPFTDCITPNTIKLACASLGMIVLLLTQAPAVPWDWTCTLVLLVVTAPALLTWLGPPDEHVEACHVCQIGKGSAYSHYFGYLRLMQGEHGTRKRLQAFKRDNVAALPSDMLEDFHCNAVVVLAPGDGEYPCDVTDLNGIGKKVGEVPPFKCTVGGNKRSYGGFNVHEVTISDGSYTKYVALDKIQALSTLQKLRQHGPVGLSDADCRRQMSEMMDELEKIIEDNGELRGQLKVVRYKRDEKVHVGDIIIASLVE